MPEYNINIEESQEEDSDLELQLAFKKGLLKPGLNCPDTKRPKVNNKPALQRKLEELKSNLPWIERLDMTCDLAPIDPALALQISNTESSNEEGNDFIREMSLYRLGQAAVLEGIARLHSLGIKTKRPDDYLAEMAKSDEHMHKIRKRLQYQEKTLEDKEKAKSRRQLKAFGKKVQIERTLEKHKEKREIMDKIKKFKKGKLNNLDFLDDKRGREQTADSGGMMKSQAQLKREQMKKKSFKNEKFSHYNTKKAGWKRNTAEDMNVPIEKAGKSKPQFNTNKRLGKNVRKKIKGRK